MREAFEKWCATPQGQRFILARAGDGYSSDYTRRAFDVWQAAYRAAIEDAWAEVNGMIRPGDISGNGCDQTATRNGLVLAANAIRGLTE